MGSEPYDTASHAELGLMQGFPPEPDKQVTRVNGLWQPPYNRWAFQNFRSLLPTRTIGHAAQPTALQRALDPGIEELTVSREDGSASDFRTYLREAFVDSFTVLHKGTVVYETYLNSMTPATPHIMFSCTKSFVGLWALMAIEQGLISDDTPSPT